MRLVEREGVCTRQTPIAPCGVRDYLRHAVQLGYTPPVFLCRRYDEDSEPHYPVEVESEGVCTRQTPVEVSLSLWSIHCECFALSRAVAKFVCSPV